MIRAGMLMTTQHCLVFENEAVATAALDGLAFAGRVDLGQNPRELDQAAGCYDAQGNPIWKQHTGYHVNVLCENGLPEVLEQYEAHPVTKMCVFAGYE